MPLPIKLYIYIKWQFTSSTSLHRIWSIALKLIRISLKTHLPLFGKVSAIKTDYVVVVCPNSCNICSNLNAINSFSIQIGAIHYMLRVPVVSIIINTLFVLIKSLYICRLVQSLGLNRIISSSMHALAFQIRRL